MTPFAPPLLRVTPQRLTPAETDAFARRTGWVDDIAAIDAEHSHVECTPLPWWPGVDLLVARDPRWMGASPVAAWLRAERLYRLTGESTPIHTINARFRPQLDDATVLQYLGFFCFFVSSLNGPFVILERLDDAARIGASIDAKWQDKLRPATIVERQDDGYRCEAVVWYEESLFLANFIVRPDGSVEMSDDEPLATGIGSRCAITYRLALPSAHSLQTAAAT